MREIIGIIIRMNLVGMYGILLVLVIRLLLRKISHRYVYVLWVIAFCMLILPAGITGEFSLVPGVITRPYVSMVDNRENGAEANGNNINTDKVYSESTVVQGVVKENIPVFDGNVKEDYYSGSTHLQEDMKWEIVPVIIWCVGVLILVIWEAARYIRLYQYIRSREIVEKDSSGRVVVLRGLETPFVFGFINPTIYLSDNMTAGERSYILAHEQYHCKRRDSIIKAVIMLITFAYWYNPIVWLGYHFFSIDMELSCDEAVLEKLSGTIKKDYAAGLLKYGALQNRYVISVMTFGKPNLKYRIQNVLNYKRKNLFFSVVAIMIIVLVAIGLVCRPADEKDDVEENKTFYENENVDREDVDKEDVYGGSSEEVSAEDGTEKIVFEDFDQNGIDEYAIISIDTDSADYDGRLQFYWNGECVYDYHAILRIICVAEAGYVDLDEDGEKEVYLIFDSSVNSMPLEEYIVLKQRGDVWEPLEMYHGETMLDNEFPVTVKGGSGETIVMSCEGTDQTVSYELENYWNGILRACSDEDCMEADMVQQDRKNFKEGENYGSVLAWGIWEVKQGSFEGTPCLIASHGIGGIDSRSYPVGTLDVWFNYDSDGNIQILNLKFNPAYQTEELVYMLEGVEEREFAVRHRGTYYSILIPEKDWEHVSVEDEKETDLWSYVPNDEIQLRVISLGDMGKEEAAEWVIQKYGEYNLEDNGFGELSGTTANGQRVLDVRILQLNETCAVVRSYPLEAAEGAGARMRVMANSFVFEDMPGRPKEFSYAELSEQEFWFCSGAGGWRTLLYVNEDGSFYGNYEDGNVGTVYLCDFTGRFSEPVKVNDYTWSARIESIEQAEETGKEETRNGINYIYSTPYGLEQAGEILFFMPGTQTSVLPEGFMSWVNGPRWGENRVLHRMNCYGIYNVNEEMGFCSFPLHLLH